VRQIDLSCAATDWQMVDFGRAGLEIWRFYLRFRYRLIAFYRQSQQAWMSENEYRPQYSIISAVYNVESYLHQYFISIVIQQKFCSEIQLILVDDGSTDRSAAMLEKWRRRFPRNIVVLRQSNGGQGVARNTGLRHAVAPWITFIDPDDFIERDYFARVGRFIRRHDRKVVLNFVSDVSRQPSAAPPL
jgi:cellulose synthase/poly-beta-1,6-N-acetylglucosamine synthase-like glycosyltransferase